MKEQIVQSDWDAKQAQERVESYNKEVRERRLKSIKRRQEKVEHLKRMRAEEKCSIDDAFKDPTIEDESENDIYEVIKMKKVNQKFSKLMSFDLEHQFNRTALNTGFVPTANNLSALDNMRLNQSRFKNGLASGVKLSKQAPEGYRSQQKRVSIKKPNKPFKVRFSLDKSSDEEEQKQANHINHQDAPPTEIGN